MLNLLTASRAAIQGSVGGWLDSPSPDGKGPTLAAWLRRIAADDWGYTPVELAGETCALALGVPSDQYDVDTEPLRLVTRAGLIEWHEVEYDGSSWFTAEYELPDYEPGVMHEASYVLDHHLVDALNERCTTQTIADAVIGFLIYLSEEVATDAMESHVPM